MSESKAAAEKAATDLASPGAGQLLPHLQPGHHPSESPQPAAAAPHIRQLCLPPPQPAARSGAHRRRPRGARRPGPLNVLRIGCGGMRPLSSWRCARVFLAEMAGLRWLRGAGGGVSVEVCVWAVTCWRLVLLDIRSQMVLRTSYVIEVRLNYRSTPMHDSILHKARHKRTLRWHHQHRTRWLYAIRAATFTMVRHVPTRAVRAWMRHAMQPEHARPPQAVVHHVDSHPFHLWARKTNNATRDDVCNLIASPS